MDLKEMHNDVVNMINGLLEEEVDMTKAYVQARQEIAGDPDALALVEKLYKLSVIEIHSCIQRAETTLQIIEVMEDL